MSQQSFANQEKRRFCIKYPVQITSFMNYFNWLESELMSKQIGFDEHAQRLERMEDTIYKRIIIHNALCGEDNLDY